MASSLDPSDLAARLQRVAEPDFAGFELLYSTQSHWPKASESSSTSDPIHIAVMDSSYNPPHRAHLPMSCSTFPPHPKFSRPGPYTARLLLFSARNVDKTLKPGDPTLAQRIEMMRLQAIEMGQSSDPTIANVAVAALNEPTFVGKSRVIHQWLRKWSTQPVTLTFLIGSDTLARLCNPQYYPQEKDGMRKALRKLFAPPPDGDGSYIACARRGRSIEARVEEHRVLESDDAKEWVESGNIRMYGDANTGWEEISSSTIRAAIRKEGQADDELQRLCLPSIVEYIQREKLYISGD